MLAYQLLCLTYKTLNRQLYRVHYTLKGELLGKNEVILDVWPWNYVSIFDNLIY